MNMYNIVEYIKDYIGVNAAPIADNLDRMVDVGALRSLSNNIDFRHSRNGTSYCYYVIQDMADRDLIRMLFRRNGLTPEFHNSKYFYHMDTTPVFRIPRRAVAKDKQRAQFLDMLVYDLRPDQVVDAHLCSAHIARLRQQMRKKTK